MQPAMLKRKKKKYSSLREKTSVKQKKRKNFSLTKRGYITYILIGIAIFAFLMATGFQNGINPSPDGTKYILVTPTSYGGYKSLELHTLNFITEKPTAVPTAAPASGTNQQAQCNDSNINEETENYEASDPTAPQAAVAGGQIKVWVTDENTP